MTKILLFALLASSFQTAYAQQNSSSKSYGIIFSGGIMKESNHYRYYATTAEMHKAYIESGVDKKDIYTYFASGNSKTSDTRKIGVRDKDFEAGKKDLTFNAASSFKKNENIDVNGPATAEDLKKAFISIAAKAKPGDVVNIFITDHGSSKGNVIAWGAEPKPDSEKTEEQRAYDKQHGVQSMRAKIMTPDQLKEMIKLLPPGVTVQIANNICYGGKLVELTDPDSNVCVVSQVDEKRPSQSKDDGSPFATAYASSLSKKNFSESFQAARDGDLLPLNEGAQNSLDYYVENELNKLVKTKKQVCASPKATGSAGAAQQFADPLAVKAEILAVKAQFEATQKKLNSAKAKQTNYVDNEYFSARNELTREHQKIANLKAGPEKDLAYGAYNKKVDALQEIKKSYEVKSTNLKEYVDSYQQQILFLKMASPEQLEKYRKIKKCMERSI